MFHTSDASNTTQTPTYFVREDRDGNPHLVRCSALRAHPTVAAAKEAKIKEIQDEMRFHLETVAGFLNDIDEAKEQQDRMRLYCEINGFLNEIEKANKGEAKVRGLSLEDGSL